MRRAHQCVLLSVTAFLALVLFSSSVAEFKSGADKDRDGSVPVLSKLQRGMTPDQVRQQMGGAPKHIARQLLYHRYREQWIYDAPNSVRLTFDCRRGQKPQLLSSSELPE
jgi:hypothetical protein